MSFIPTMIMLLIITAICYVIIKITEALNKDEQETMTTNDVVIKPIKSPKYEQLDDSYKYVYDINKALKDPIFNEVETLNEPGIGYPTESKPGIGGTTFTLNPSSPYQFEAARPMFESLPENREKKEKNTAIAGIMQSIKERAEIIEASKTDQERQLENKISQLTEEEREMLQQIINRHK